MVQIECNQLLQVSRLLNKHVSLVREKKPSPGQNRQMKGKFVQAKSRHIKIEQQKLNGKNYEAKIWR